MIAYFGDKLSHTYAAAVSLFASGAHSECDFIGYSTVYDALNAVKRGECDTAVVPIENSFEGTVTASEDALGQFGLYIVGETVLGIKQNLIALPGVSLRDIKKVYSHPQALAQCRASLRKLVPNAAAVEVAYTSAGLDMLDSHSAAIARVPKEGQVFLCDGIEDSSDNCTRFLAVRAKPALTGEKVSVLFSAENKPGALLDALEELRVRGLNMTKIESRPSKKKMGTYVFYVDFIVPDGEGELASVLEALEKKTRGVQYLGRYKQANNIV